MFCRERIEVHDGLGAGDISRLLPIATCTCGSATTKSNSYAQIHYLYPIERCMQCKCIRLSLINWIVLFESSYSLLTIHAVVGAYATLSVIIIIINTIDRLPSTSNRPIPLPPPILDESSSQCP
jgi:hypothetical protein